MRIIADVMSGDNAPLEMLRGALMAREEFGVDITLVGNPDVIENTAKENSLDLTPFEIEAAHEVVTMEDDPIAVVRAKKNSSMSVGLRMLADGRGDAFVSCGNTGALFTGASLIVRKLKGVQRAAIGTVLPTNPPTMLLDMGANVTVTDEYLEQFAIMGTAYMKGMYGIERPRVGLLNNGVEECKGTELQIAAHKRLSACESINFIGNVEANAVPFNACDVVVTDGFSGNVFLKTMEGVGKLLIGRVKSIYKTNIFTKLSALIVKKQLLQFKKDFDSSEMGGAPILGINKTVVKAHGSSDARAFRSAIRQAMECASSSMIDDIAVEAQKFAELRRAERKKAKEEAAQSEDNT